MKLNSSQSQVIASFIFLTAALSGCGNSAPSTGKITQALNKNYTALIEDAKNNARGFFFGRQPVWGDHVEIDQC